MNKTIIIVLLLCLGARPAYHLGYFAYYTLNIDEIVEKYCVNKARPEMNCDGKCYLSQQLAVTQETTSDRPDAVRSLIEIFTPLFWHRASYSLKFFTGRPSFDSYFGTARTAYLQPGLKTDFPPPRA